MMAIGTGTAIAIGAGAGLLGGMMGADAARDAASTQAGAADRASQIQLQMFEQQRNDNAPWRDVGGRALSQMQDGSYTKEDFTMADFQKDPGYQFRMDEANRALERSAAARGGLMSGGTLRALTRLNQDMASQEYQNAYNRFNADRDRRFNRLASLAGIGQTANSQIGAAGQNYANQVGQNTMGAANAIAAGQIGSANSINNMIGQGMNTWMQYQLLNRIKPETGV